MSDRPRIDYFAHPAGASQLVLLAHGGLVESVKRSADWWPPLLRMLPFAAVAMGVAPEVAVGAVRYRLQGWNGGRRDAAVDLAAVLRSLPDEIERVLLVGHSMGGRAVVAAGTDARVTGICALAPWLPPGEPIGDLTGRLLVCVHGTADTTTDPAATADYVRRCREQGLPVASFSIAGERHNMLGHARTWDDIVRRFVVAGTTGRPDPGLTAATSVDPDLATTVLPLRGSAAVWRGITAVAGAAVHLRLRR